MPIVRAQVTLPMDSGLPEDAAQNVWHFSAAVADVTTAGLIATALKNFYDSIDSFLSTAIDAANAKVEFYDLSDPEPRQAFHTQNIGQDMITAVTAIPAENALCLSFQGVPLSGVPQARRRGRVFIGPLGQSAIGAGSDGQRPIASFVTALANAGGALLAASDAAGPVWFWVVYSRVENTGIAVDNGWVDNAMDTQRRRGVNASSRTVFAAA